MTGDRDLLTLRHYREIAVVNPGQFWLALEMHSAGTEALASRFGREVLDEILETMHLAPETVARVREALALLGPGTR